MTDPFEINDRSTRQSGISKTTARLAGEIAKPSVEEREFFRQRREKDLGVGLDENGNLQGSTVQISEPRLEIEKTSLKVFRNIADAWRLSETERMAVLDINDLRKYELLMSDSGLVSSDILDRISRCLGIYKALHTIFSDSTSANEWLRRPNTARPFDGQSALTYVLEHRACGLIEVRQYLDAQCA
ncbi:MbcA/ParS/Xre antitoxin family protein [Sphingomicrobium sp. XHP0235]|uniref:MbcA/ParS/Xre antitoxin family protein n=1 Tax=Sphingomicrobium aquimarinum TaxID=3133971 RepID=UPI0031FE5A47